MNYWIVLLIILAFVGYAVQSDAELKEKIKSYGGGLLDSNKTQPFKMPPTANVSITLLDERGNPYNDMDIKVEVITTKYSTQTSYRAKSGWSVPQSCKKFNGSHYICESTLAEEIIPFRSYSDRFSQIKLENVNTSNPHKIVLAQGIGRGRIYPKEEIILFKNYTNTIIVERRAILEDLNIRIGNTSVKSPSTINIQAKNIIYFDLRVSNRGIVKEPTITIISQNNFDKFDVWLWTAMNDGVNIQGSGEKVELNKKYKVNSLTERNFAVVVLQIERISIGDFSIRVEDSQGIEKQEVKINAR